MNTKAEITYEQFLKTINSNNSDHPGECPVLYVFAILHGRWKNHVLFEMSKFEFIRFGQLKKIIPSITNTMLTSTLRELEEDGLVNRVQFNEIPPHVEYSLTNKSKELMPVFYEMYKWGTKYFAKK